MEVLIVFLIIIALLGLLDWAALRWGYNSRLPQLLNEQGQHHPDL